MVIFDTPVADLTEELNDPVELLFGVQLGGGTDIFEGGDPAGMHKCTSEQVDEGVQVIVLFALIDDGGRPHQTGSQ